MHSGREAKTLAVPLLALSACQPAQPGFTAEIGARIGYAQPSAQSLTMAPLAGGISVGRVELKPDAAPTCTSGYACLYANSSDNLLYTVDANGTTLKMHAAQSFRTSANCSALSSPAQGDVCYDTGLGVFRFRDGSGWTTAATNGSLYVTLAGIQTITGAKTFTAATLFNGAVTLGDAAADVVTSKGTLRIDNTANTFYVSLTHAASANRAVTLPDAAGQIVLDSATQTLTNKTLTAPAINGTVTTSGLTLPALTMGGALAMGTNKITGLGTPTVSTDAATKAYVDAAAPELFFSRTCTLTSAGAMSAVNCLLDADVPLTKKPYLLGWHAKVNGATPWGTAATCWIQDTSGTANYFITMAVAALTANAFVADHSANVTQNAPYSRNQGGTADLGLEVACDANGTGSDLVVTVFGVIK